MYVIFKYGSNHWLKIIYSRSIKFFKGVSNFNVCIENTLQKFSLHKNFHTKFFYPRTKKECKIKINILISWQSYKVFVLDFLKLKLYWIHSFCICLKSIKSLHSTDLTDEKIEEKLTQNFINQILNITACIKCVREDDGSLTISTQLISKF